MPVLAERDGRMSSVLVTKFTNEFESQNKFSATFNLKTVFSIKARHCITYQNRKDIFG